MCKRFRAWKATSLDTRILTISVPSHPLPGQPDNRTAVEHLSCRIIYGRSAVFVADAKDLFHLFPNRFGQAQVRGFSLSPVNFRRQANSVVAQTQMHLAMFITA